jgi:6-pyruvoyltetrahydropterin/6-carboxytetrahydropterin synthase
MKPKTTFIVTEPFEAARRVGVLPEGHRSNRLHGHSFLGSVHCALPQGLATYQGGEIDTIRARLKPQIQKLDYSLLNDHISVPTDENIARWIDTHCYVPGTEAISVQSTADEGLKIDNHGMAHVWRRYYFQAAHQLPNVPTGHKCGNMHGHGFAVVLHAIHKVGDGDLSIDYDHLDTVWEPVFAKLDHACLNNIEGLNNPTSELISQWIWNKVKLEFPELSCVTVYETASCGANYTGSQFEIWKEFTLDSSARFKHAPEGSKRRNLHGYTYTLRLHLSAPLDQVMGWAIDFGDVKEIFNPVFKEIDHKPLWQDPDIQDCDVATLAQHIFRKTHNLLPQASKLELYETKGCGVICDLANIGPSLPI